MLTIEFRGLAGDPDLRTYVEERLLSWIGHVGRELPGVTVRLEPWANGGASHVRCRMVARPLHWASVAVEKTDADPYAAIERCAKRLATYLALARRAHRAVRWPDLGAVAPSPGAIRPTG